MQLSKRGGSMASNPGGRRRLGERESVRQAALRWRLIFTTSLAVAIVAALVGAATSTAAPGNLRILIVANEPEGIAELSPVLAAEPGVGVVETFNSAEGTPSPSSLATYDLVVGTGDSSYLEPEVWGNELADYLDAGGAEIQFAYDNWESEGAHPTGRFESGGFAPFVPGPNDNKPTSLGTILVPSSPLLAGVPSFTTGDNTTTTLAAGATLLAEWSDGRPAIALKGRVVSVSASVDSGALEPIGAAAILAVDAGNALGRHTLTVSKEGTGSGTVTSTPAGVSCGATCAFNYTNGTAVTLTAASSPGSSFAGWSGAGCSGTSSCTVTMTAAQTVRASFTVVPPPIPIPILAPTPRITAPHNTKITKAKINKRKHLGSFAFSASGTVAGFQCALVKLVTKKGKHHGKPKVVFSRCGSPKIYRHLKRGHYTFEVRAINSIGHDAKPAIKSFQI
jgi:hypothetical protein